jgi:hypothetical protein
VRSSSGAAAEKGSAWRAAAALAGSNVASAYAALATARATVSASATREDVDWNNGAGATTSAALVVSMESGVPRLGACRRVAVGGRPRSSGGDRRRGRGGCSAWQRRHDGQRCRGKERWHFPVSGREGRQGGAAERLQQQVGTWAHVRSTDRLEMGFLQLAVLEQRRPGAETHCKRRGRGLAQQGSSSLRDERRMGT